MKGWSIRARVMLLALAPSAVIAVLLSLYFISSRFDDLEQALRARGRTIVGLMGPAAQYGLFSGNRAELARLADSTMAEPDVAAVTIQDELGAVLALRGSPSDSVTPIDTKGDIREAQTRDGMRRVYTVQVHSTRVNLEPHFLGGSGEEKAASQTPRSLGLVAVEISRENLVAWKRRQLAMGLGLGLLVLAISALAALRTSRKTITAPIQQLSSAVSVLAQGRLETRVQENSSGELLVLQRGVNQMAEALSLSRRDLEQRIATATAELAAKKEQAEASSASKTRFLAAASHDLRQPMQALALWIRALQLRAQDPAVQDIAVKIDDSVTVLGEMLNALLDISKIDAGAVKTDIRAVSLDVLFDRLELQFEGPAQNKGLRLRVRRGGLAVRSDSVLLLRILHNLASNAVKHTEQGTVLVCARLRGRHVHIEVRDSGPGIPRDQQKLIFEEFYQVGNPERDRAKGLGLGLAIVDRFVRLLNHRCEVRSREGRGSVFMVEAPLARLPALAPSKSPTRTPDDLASLRDLFVALLDDDPLVRSGMADLIRSVGSECLVASTSSELESKLALASRLPDVIICDYRLPHGENGLEVIKRVRAKLARQVPCVLITGDLSEEVSRVAEAAGVKLLQKPVRPERLAAVLADLTGPS